MHYSRKSLDAYNQHHHYHHKNYNSRAAENNNGGVYNNDHKFYYYNSNDQALQEYYIFYINGENVDKKFAKQFVDHVCNGKIKNAINVEECTRKRLVISSRDAAEELLAVNRQVFWPDGTLFRCKLIQKPSKRSFSIKERESTPFPRRRWDKQQIPSYVSYYRNEKYPQHYEDQTYSERENKYSKRRRDSKNSNVSFQKEDRYSKRLRSLTPISNDHDRLNVDNGNPGNDKDDDWYNSAAFVDVDIGSPDNIITTTSNNINGLH
ncbi:LEF-6 [Rachiplusia nu nucleopolyhedrovirus]|uniref:LEF-6 n=1 Tax=Rachiplusia nu nucleopolyhedrovirus TaxID=2605775 RepID=A0AAF1DB47_9ABAC|nr:LEF-6 [Rachiplusia nu nucleopolyhedrovirus]QEI03647.1 LEF-6 [Rachiplusia nu nucleopolyhedrovirus]